MKTHSNITSGSSLLATACTLIVISIGTLSADQFGLFTYEVANGEVTITGHESAAGEIVIPSEIDGIPVTAIGDHAFFDCIGLTGATIPSTVTRLGVSALAHTAMTTVIIPDSVTGIERSALASCTEVTQCHSW